MSEERTNNTNWMGIGGEGWGVDELERERHWYRMRVLFHTDRGGRSKGTTPRKSPKQD